jgi:hypothetical protein
MTLALIRNVFVRQAHLPLTRQGRRRT